MSTTIIEHLQSIAGPRDSLCYFYFDYRSQDNHCLRHVCETLAVQLLSSLPDPPSSLAAEVDQWRKKRSIATTEVEALSFLQEFIHATAGHSWVVLDGVDEAPDVAKAARFASQLTRSGQGKLRMVVLGRDLPEIRRIFQQDRHLVIDCTDNSSDIYAYVAHSIDAMELEINEADVKRLTDMLYRGAQGSFMWANLMVQHLKTSTISLYDMHSALKDPVPFMQEELCSKSIAQLSFLSLSRQRLSKRLITWICCAHRRMSLEELQGAMAICSIRKTYDPSRKPFISVIRQVSSPLFEVHGRSHIMRPFHTIVEDYLTGDPPCVNPALQGLGFHVKKTEAHQKIADECLILLHDLFTKSSRELSQCSEPIARYACNYWLNHLLNSDLASNAWDSAFRFLKSGRRRKWPFYFLFWQRRTFPLYRLISLQTQLKKRLCEHGSNGDHCGLDWALDIANVLLDSRLTRPHLQRSSSARFSHFEIMMVIRDLARYFTQSRKINDARNLYDHALGVERSLPYFQRDLGTEVFLMNTLGILLDQVTELDRAIDMQRGALNLLNLHSSNATQSQLVIWTKNELGRLYRHRGSYSVALSMHFESLDALGKIEAPLDPTPELEVAWTRSTLARSFRRQQAFDQAIYHCTAALVVRDRILGPKHPHSLWLRSDLAQCHFESGNREIAAAEHRKIKSAREEVLGPDNPDTMWTLNNLGVALEHSGMQGAIEALEIQKLALKGQEKVLGADHLHTRWTRAVVRRLQASGSTKLFALPSLLQRLANRHQRLLNNRRRKKRSYVRSRKYG